MSTPSEDAQTRKYLALILITMICVVLGLLFWREAPKANETLLSLVLGSLLTKLTDVYAFNFNSSASSHAKDAVISKMANAAETVATVAQVAQASPAVVTTETLIVPEGSSVTATATPGGGTIISAEDDGNAKVAP